MYVGRTPDVVEACRLGMSDCFPDLLSKWAGEEKVESVFNLARAPSGQWGELMIASDVGLPGC
jgi:hypothetical protein